MIYFESLLDNADNELVEQAKKDGKMIMGYTCYHIPEVLLNVDNCVSVRMRAPRTGSIDISTYYMSNYVCEFARALLERAIEGGYQFLDGIAGVDACSMMNRFYEHFSILKCNDKDHFFLPILDVPYKTEDFSYKHMQRQLEVRLLDAMKEHLGTDISDAKIREAVALHNEVCAVIQEISEMRKEENPVITGYEFHILNLVSYTCPKYLILPYLKETLAELKKRKPDKVLPRARVGIVGSEIDDPEFTKMIEDAGARVVFDRHCFGSIPGREVIELSDKEDALPQIVRHYMNTSECARYIADNKVKQRRETADRLAAKEFKADGIIYEQMKYCDFWGFERALVSHIMAEEYGWPVLSIDRLYNARGSGQLRTRFQAFVESLEIKKIQKGGKK